MQSPRPSARTSVFDARNDFIIAFSPECCMGPRIFGGRIADWKVLVIPVDHSTWTCLDTLDPEVGHSCRSNPLLHPLRRRNRPITTPVVTAPNKVFPWLRRTHPLVSRSRF